MSEEYDSHTSLGGLYHAEIDGTVTKDWSTVNLASPSGINCRRIGSVKKLPSAIEVSKETLSLLLKARDDLKKQEVSKVQVVAECADQFEENNLGVRQSNKPVEITSNNLSTASTSKIMNNVGYLGKNQEENFETSHQVTAVQFPLQVVTPGPNKPFQPVWFEHDDRLREEVATAASLNGGKITNKSSHEAANSWEHDLYDTSKADSDFPGYSNQLVCRSTLDVEKKMPKNKSEIVDRWGHDLFDATEQTPKSDQEFLDFYGYERRQVNSSSAQRYSRGGPSQIRSSLEEGAKSGYFRAFRGRGGATRSQPRSEDQVKFQKDEISTLNKDMKNVYL